MQKWKQPFGSWRNELLNSKWLLLIIQLLLPVEIFGSFQERASTRVFRYIGVLLVIFAQLSKEWHWKCLFSGCLTQVVLAYALMFIPALILMIGNISTFGVLYVSLSTILYAMFVSRRMFWVVSAIGMIFILFGLLWMQSSAVTWKQFCLLVYGYAIVAWMGHFSRRQKTPSDVTVSAQAVCDHMAHAVRTPLATLSLSLEALERSTVGDSQKATLDRMRLVLRRAFIMVDRLVLNLKRSFSHFPLKQLSMQACAEEAISDYPMSSQERALVTLEAKQDFQFDGNEALMHNLFVNLLKNALFEIKKCNQGSIFITIDAKDGKGIVVFWNSVSCATKFPAESIHHQNGLGLGLLFCQKAMRWMNGSSHISFQDGKFFEFLLTFPLEAERTSKLKSESV